MGDCPVTGGILQGLGDLSRGMPTGLIAFLVIVAGLVTWTILAKPMVHSTETDVVEVTLKVNCGRCLTCEQPCPACDHKRGSAPAGVSGVVTASFTQNGSYSIERISYQSLHINLSFIESTTERAPPFRIVAWTSIPLTMGDVYDLNYSAIAAWI